jgi:fumarate hydratase subunit alpha
MREISAELIPTTVKDLCMNAACDLPNDVENLIPSGLEKEESQFVKKYKTGT